MIMLFQCAPSTASHMVPGPHFKNVLHNPPLINWFSSPSYWSVRSTKDFYWRTIVVLKLNPTVSMFVDMKRALKIQQQYAKTLVLMVFSWQWLPEKYSHDFILVFGSVIYHTMDMRHGYYGQCFHCLSQGFSKKGLFKLILSLPKLFL